MMFHPQTVQEINSTMFHSTAAVCDV